MSTIMVSQQVSAEMLLDEFEMVFPLSEGIKIFPPPPGKTKKPVYTVKTLTRAMVREGYGFGPYAVGLYLPKDAKSQFCVIDLDAGGAYHTVEVAQQLIQLASAKGVDLHLMRSSSSGGWHLVGFFAEQVSNAQVANVLQALTIKIGLTLKSGQCELYPSPGASRKAVRLPFQPESAWLDPKDGSVILESRSLTPAGRLQNLLAKVSASTTTAATIAKADVAARQMLSRKGIKRSRPKPKSKIGPPATRKAGASGRNPTVLSSDERFDKGRQYYLQGLTEAGQLNEALFLVGNYLFLKYPDRYGYDHPDERADAILEWITANHNGKSRTINGGGWKDVKTDIGRLTHTSRRTPRDGSEYRFAGINKYRNSVTKAKLLQALYALDREGKTLTQVSQVELARLSGLTRPTLRKNEQLIVDLDDMWRHGFRI